jgi:hypothetical protein
MTLSNFIAQLIKLEREGNGEKQVFYYHSASGDCGPLGHAHITSHVGECGPFDLPNGQEYVSISAGS